MCATFKTIPYLNIKKWLVTPNPTRELEWTVDLFDELIGARIYMFQWGEAPSYLSMFEIVKLSNLYYEQLVCVISVNRGSHGVGDCQHVEMNRRWVAREDGATLHVDIRQLEDICRARTDRK